MSASPLRTASPPVDPALVAEIVRQVRARLREAAPSTRAPSSDVVAVAAAPAKLVTVASVAAAAAAGAAAISIVPGAVITPAARDEAGRLGVRFEPVLAAISTQADRAPQEDRARRNDRAPRGDQAPRGDRAPREDRASTPGVLSVIDTTAESWAESVLAQLDRRGVAATTGPAPQRLVLTDRPASQTHEHSASGAHRAVMIDRVTHVDRFRRELAPDVWVVDKTELNLPAIVNIAVRISHTMEAPR